MVYHLNWNVNSIGFIASGTKKKKVFTDNKSLKTVTHGGLAKLLIQAEWYLIKMNLF